MRVRARAEVNSKTLDELSHQGLSPGREYLVVGYDDEYYRVINDGREPILYPRHLFEVVSPREPPFWVRNNFENGEYHVGPAECLVPGFYEDLFDGDEQARAVFDRIRSDTELVDSACSSK